MSPINFPTDKIGLKENKVKIKRFAQFSVKYLLNDMRQ